MLTPGQFQFLLFLRSSDPANTPTSDQSAHFATGMFLFRGKTRLAILNLLSTFIFIPSFAISPSRCSEGQKK